MRKVLVISYYWPPAGGPGVQRWLKFTKYLKKMGFDPIVYIPENAHYPIQDASLIHEIPEEITIIQGKISEPYKWAKLFSKRKTKQISSGIIDTENPSFLEKIMLFLRGNFFIPDARVNWVKPSIRFLSTYVSKEHIETVITTGPPHSVHLIGLGLKQQLDLTWISDFRDPWTSIGYHKKLRLGRRAQKKHENLEKTVLNSVDKIIVTSKACKKEFIQLTKKPIKVITNGYEIKERNEITLDTTFSISHIGSLLEGRNPLVLWKVLSEMVKHSKKFSDALQLKFVGVISNEARNSLNELGLAKYVIEMGYLPHEQARKQQLSSQVLLLLEIDSAETAGIIPGKLFEYMDAHRPVLAIGPKNWEAGEMVTKYNLGHYVHHDQQEEVKKIIHKWFEQYQNGVLQVQSVEIEKYTRENLTRELAKFI